MKSSSSPHHRSQQISAKNCCFHNIPLMNEFFSLGKFVTTVLCFFCLLCSIENGSFIVKDLNCSNFSFSYVESFFLSILDSHWIIRICHTYQCAVNWLLEVRGMKMEIRWCVRKPDLAQNSNYLCGILAVCANSLGILRS